MEVVEKKVSMHCYRNGGGRGTCWLIMAASSRLAVSFTTSVTLWKTIFLTNNDLILNTNIVVSFEKVSSCH